MSVSSVDEYSKDLTVFKKKYNKVIFCSQCDSTEYEYRHQWLSESMRKVDYYGCNIYCLE